MERIENFISNLSLRLNSENNLSDITWTMCETSDLFLTAFLDFFFPKEKFGEVFLQREFSDEDCRPDFYFDHEGKVFLIECKIWDRSNPHFEQYTKQFKIPNEQLGYITNYPMVKEGFVIHTWTELYTYLKKRIPQQELELWNGYLDYLKQVCNIFIPEKPMNLDGMFSLYTFYRSLDEVVVCDGERFTSTLCGKNNTNYGSGVKLSPQRGVMGKYFQVKFKKTRLKQTIGWMGVFFDCEHPQICVGFDYWKDWGKPVYNLLCDNIDKAKKGKYHDGFYEDGGAIWFDFNKEEKFNSLDNVSKQIALLKSYFNEVLETIYKIKQES